MDFLGSWVQIPPSTTIITFFSDFPHVELGKKILSPVSPGNETAFGYIIDRPARISGRPAIPSFQGGSVLLEVGLGKLYIG